MFDLELARVRRQKCNTDKRNVVAKERVNCPHRIIRLAGWHFSYVLTDAGILKKIRASADFTTSKITIMNFTEYRMGGVYPDSYTKDFGLL
jgi:hypothetical protein